eukprot:TRINITY_DN5996_c0_g1_i1.p1 TRINITY_DN5996_c0_g1~~TRINITY_DN5996_c0_g1_i1.p1  ORF type:complete len:151 (-),score=19.59 TRINITY_DN5996_c0_g1_i1:347-739(-)
MCIRDSLRAAQLQQAQTESNSDRGNLRVELINFAPRTQSRVASRTNSPPRSVMPSRRGSSSLKNEMSDFHMQEMESHMWLPQISETMSAVGDYEEAVRLRNNHQQSKRKEHYEEFCVIEQNLNHLYFQLL